MVLRLPLLHDQSPDLVVPLLDIVCDASDLWVYPSRESRYEGDEIHAFDPRGFKTHSEGLKRVLLRNEGLHAVVSALVVIQELLFLNREVREFGALLEGLDVSGGKLEKRHRTIQTLLDEIELVLCALSDPVPSEVLQRGSRCVEDFRPQDRVGPPVAHVHDVRRLEGLGRHPTLNLTQDIVGGMNHQSEAAVLIRRGLRGKPEKSEVENRADRAGCEFSASGIQNPGERTRVVVCELEWAIRHSRINPGIQEQVRANQVGVFREHTHPQCVDHAPGDLRRGQHLDL